MQQQQMMKNENSLMAAAGPHHHLNNSATNTTSTANQTPSMTNNTTMNSEQQASSNAAVNIKCVLCEKDLDGSFRIMKHAVCGLRYCAHHMQEVLASPHHSICPRCGKEISKEDLICTPSLSASGKDAPNNSTYKSGAAGAGQQSHHSQHRMRLMPATAGGGGSTTPNGSDMALLYDCPICSLGGLTHSQLLDHSKQHANIPGKCPICWQKQGRDYFSKHLYGHLMLRHKDAAPVQGGSGKTQATANGNHVGAANHSTVAQTISHRSQVQQTNQTQLQASKGIQQSQQQRQPGALPSAMSKMQSATASNSRPSAVQVASTMKERRNTTNLSAMASTSAGYHGMSSLTGSTSSKQTQQAQSVLSTMLSQMQQQNQSMTATPSGSQSVNTTQASRKKTGGSHRSSMQSHPSHAQFAAASKRGPSGGAKTPQITSLATGGKQGSRLKGLTSNSNGMLINAAGGGNGQRQQQNGSAIQHMMQSQVLQSSQDQATFAAYMRRGMSARGDQSRSSQIMFNREGGGAAVHFLDDKQSQCLSQGLLGVYTFSTVRQPSAGDAAAAGKPQLQEEESKSPIAANQPVRKLQLTSQYVASSHKFSLLKRQSPTCSFKLTDLEKFLHNNDSVVQDHKKDSNRNEPDGDDGGSCGHTDDGLSSASSRSPEKDGEANDDEPDDEMMIKQQQLEQSANNNELGTPVSHVRQKQQTTAHKGKSGTQQFKTKAGYMQQPQLHSKNQPKRSKQQPGRMSIDASRQRQIQQQESDLSSVARNHQKYQRRASHVTRKTRSAKALQVPLYLQEVEKICFPDAMPCERHVLLQKDTRRCMFVDSEKLSPDLLKLQLQQNAAQLPHQQNYFSQGKKLSVSPHASGTGNKNINWKSGLQLKQPQAPAPPLNDIERHSSLPRFNSSVNTPQMMLVQKGVSPKGHYGTKRVQEPQREDAGADDEAEEAQYCTLEDLESFHKQVFYSTRTADDKVQYLSILVCAQPQIHESSRPSGQNEGNQSDSGGRELSDAIISDEDVESERSRNCVKATLQPFVLVIVTSRPVFESAMGSQILDLIYQKCFLPLYRKICFPSQLLNRHFLSYQQHTSDTTSLRDMLVQQVDLEVVISMLFDVLNVFCLAKEDTYRRVSWQDPLVHSELPTRSLLQVNQIFLANQNFFFDGNFSFKLLFKLIQVDDLIKLFSCLLLEKKIVFVGDDDTYQEQLAPLIEAFLKLYYPLDSQVYTNVSYPLSQDMVYCMEKPGSIIMGMPKHLWTSHGQRVFNDSFDTYIVVYDLQERAFHLKTPDQPIGIPRTFSKLLRRSISAIDLTMSDAYISFQLRQAVFNTLLLMISYLKNKEAKKVTKRLQAQMTGEKKEAGDSGGEDSANSVQTIRDGQPQYPYSREFFNEFKTTTAFIDLSDKLERKDSSVAFITDCLAIIEQQKIDWFVKLLEFQVSFMAQDMNHIVKLFYPQANQRVEDPFKELSFEEVAAVHRLDHPAKIQPRKLSPSRRSKEQVDAFNYARMASVFKIQRRLVSKTLRSKLFELKSFALVQHQNNEAIVSEAPRPTTATTPGKFITNRITAKARGGMMPGKLGSQELLSSRNEVQFASLTPKNVLGGGSQSLIAHDHKLASMNVSHAGLEMHASGHEEVVQKMKPPRFPPQQPDRDTPNQTDSSKKIGSHSTPPERIAPCTPDGTVQKAFALANEESEVPPSSQRAARYGSTHKPQISFQQVRSSDSPPSAALPPDNTPKVQDSPAIQPKGQKEASGAQDSDKNNNAVASSGGFFSMITNFFSSNKGVDEDANKQKEEQKSQVKKDQNLSLQEEMMDFQGGRKASKSMQVMQPQFMTFHRPIDMQAVAQIKTLSSGLNILKSHINESSSKISQAAHRKQKSSINEFSKNVSQNPLSGQTLLQSQMTDKYIFSQTQHQHQRPQQQQEQPHQQPHMRQETATFVKEASAQKSLYSSSRRVETAQFAASSPVKTSLNDLTEKQKFSIKNYQHHPPDADYQRQLRPFATSEQTQQAGLLRLSMETQKMASQRLSSDSQSQALKINRFHEALSQVENRGLMNNRPAASVPESMDVMADDDRQSAIQLLPVEDMEDDSGTTMQTFANEEGMPDRHQVLVSIAQKPRGGKKQREYDHAMLGGADQNQKRNSVPIEPMCLSARCSNDSKGGSAIGLVNQEVRISAPTYINSQRTPISASNGKQQASKEAIIDSGMEQQYASRPNFAHAQQQKYPSPKKTTLHHQQLQHEPAKRLSLNAINNAVSKLGGANQNQHSQKNYASEQQQIPVSAMIGNTNNLNYSANSAKDQQQQLNMIKTTTINLEQPGVGTSSVNNSSSKFDSQSLKIGTQQASSSSNSQKLKITINKLHSKQIFSTQGMHGGCGQGKPSLTTSQPLLQTVASTHGYNSNNRSSFKESITQQQQQVAASQSALSFSTKVQKQSSGGSNAMRNNLKQCTSPKIVSNKQHNIGGGGSGFSASAGGSQASSALNHHQKVVPGGVSHQMLHKQHSMKPHLTSNQLVTDVNGKTGASSFIKMQKQLSSSSQNLKGTLSQPRKQQTLAGAQNHQQVLSNGDNQLLETSRRGGVHNNAAAAATDNKSMKGAAGDIAAGQRSKKLAGEIASSNVHLFSPKKSTSPQPDSYKSRPKAYSQFSHGQQQQQMSDTEGIQGHQIPPVSSSSSSTLKHHTSQSQYSGSQKHQLAAKAAVTNTLRQSANLTSVIGSQQPGDNSNIVLKKGRTYQPSNSQHLQHRDNGNAKDSFSTSKSTNILQQITKQGASNTPLHQSRIDGKRNSMGQLPKAQQVILASRQNASSMQQKFDLLTISKEAVAKEAVNTPSDCLHNLDSTMPKNPRKQQRLTNVAQEKKGDEEEEQVVIEMENIQEGALDDGFEGSNRIRSISHQFPSNKISFLRASQDKMQIPHNGVRAIGLNHERSLELVMAKQKKQVAGAVEDPSQTDGMSRGLVRGTSGVVSGNYASSLNPVPSFGSATFAVARKPQHD